MGRFTTLTSRSLIAGLFLTLTLASAEASARTNSDSTASQQSSLTADTGTFWHWLVSHMPEGDNQIADTGVFWHWLTDWLESRQG